MLICFEKKCQYLVHETSSEQGYSSALRSPIITRRKSVPRKLCEEDFSPEISPVKRETKEDAAYNDLFGWIDDKGRRSRSRSRRPAKRLRYTFDDDDQEKLEKLEKSREEKIQPEINDPGVVENRRQLKMNKYPTTSSEYLESKVIKVEEEKSSTAATSTPKKKSKAKLREASRKAKETLARLETKLEKVSIKKVDSKTIIYHYILHQFLGYKGVIDQTLMSTSKPSTPGGNQIYTTFTFHTTLSVPSYPISSPYALYSLHLFVVFLSLVMFQVPVHRQCVYLLGLLQVLPVNHNNLQYLKTSDLFRESTVRYESLILMPGLISFNVIM